MSVLTRVCVLGAALLLVGCQEHEFHPPDQEARVAHADSLYAPAMFDSIKWTSDSLRVSEGNEVYAARCDRCHGPLGAGGTDYAREQQLEVPSLVRADWPYADHDAVRKRIFTGHPAGMPIWGMSNLSLREIDAVAAYVLEVLRASAR
jgi:mono/diheme cytochrome c family protein